MKDGMVVIDPKVLRKRLSNKIETYRDDMLAAGFKVDKPYNFDKANFEPDEKPEKSKFKVVGSFPGSKGKYITLSATIDKSGNSNVWINKDGVLDNNTWSKLRDTDQLKKFLTANIKMSKKSNFVNKVKSKLKEKE